MMENRILGKTFSEYQNFLNSDIGKEWELNGKNNHSLALEISLTERFIKENINQWNLFTKGRTGNLSFVEIYELQILFTKKNIDKWNKYVGFENLQRDYDV